MNHAKTSNIAFIALLAIVGILFAITLALFEQERSKDVVRITLTDKQVYGYDVAPLANQLQRVTGREAYLVRLNGTNSFNATKWQLRIDDKSAKLDPEN